MAPLIFPPVSADNGVWKATRSAFPQIAVYCRPGMTPQLY
jgi:hypothetical protein